jgi:hypothetical protein
MGGDADRSRRPVAHVLVGAGGAPVALGLEAGQLGGVVEQ